MEIQNLVDRLEQVLNDSTRVPMSAYLMVNEDKIYNIVDQLRITVPDEIKRANRIESEKERILAQAHEEAERIRELAKQEATELVNREVITSAAQQRADLILERARRDAQSLRQEADIYVVNDALKNPIGNVLWRNDGGAREAEGLPLYEEIACGDVPEEEYSLELGKANVVREGEQVTLIAYGAMVPVAEKAAAQPRATDPSAVRDGLRSGDCRREPVTNRYAVLLKILHA